MKKNGFTLIELVMVIIILGILAAVAIPKFFDLQNQAKASAEQGVVGSVRAGIHNFYANAAAGGTAAWPESLDSVTGVAAGTACSSSGPCFVVVLSQGVTTSDWKKTGAFTYVGPAGNTYNYYPAEVTGTAKAGEFKQVVE